jgi:hypothetical protein
VAQKSLMAIKNALSRHEMAKMREAEPMIASTTITGNSDLGQNWPGLSALARPRED